MKHRLHDVRYLVQLAVLTALLLLLEITGLGYIKTPVLEFTVMQVPVILGAIILGPGAGALLGGVFGLTSFWECFGKSTFGMQLLAIDPWATAVVCIVPRLLMGLCCGLIFGRWRQSRESCCPLRRRAFPGRCSIPCSL